MNSWLLVFIGGGLGSITRMGIGNLIKTLNRGGWPWATFTANLLASAIIGFLAAWILLRPGNKEQERLFIGVGFCGGLSTFSTFTLEVAELLREGNTVMAFVYILASVLSCLLAFWLAWWMSRA